MSTKTSIKRIALVAAAALALGGFSAVSANATTTAAATPIYVSAADSGANPTAAAATMTATAVAGPYNYVTLTSSTAISAGTLGVSVSTSTGSKLSVVTQPSPGSETATVSTDGLSAVSTGTGANLVLKLSTPAAGTIIVTVTKNVDASGIVTTTTLQTITIQVNAASLVGTFSATNSFVKLFDTTTTDNASVIAKFETGTVGTAVTAASVSDTTPVTKGTIGSPTTQALVVVRLQDTQASPAALAGKVLTASITGTGLVAGTGSNLSDTSSVAWTTAAVVAQSLTDVAGWAFFVVKNSGAAGTGNITVSYTDGNGVTNTVGNASIVFYGSVASLVAKPGLSVLNNSAATGASTDTGYAVQLVGKDSSGNEVDISGLTIVGTSSTTSVIANTSANGGANSAAGTADPLARNLTVTGASTALSGQSATVTWSYTDANGVVYSTAAVPFTVGGTSISSLALSFDKASYSIGDVVTATLTAKDSLGNPVADKTYSVFDTTTSTTVFGTSAQLTSTPFGSRYIAFKGGKATATFYAPFTSGNLVLTATAGGTAGAAWNDVAAAAAASTITGTVAISGATSSDASLALDAANAATDAANNAYDEAQNATQAASDALAAVKALAVQVKALIALVTKIKNKVGA